jgi:hypothetical protein
MENIRDSFLKEQAEIEKNFNPRGQQFIGDSMANDEGFGFLYNSLEYIDSRLHEPMYNFFWYRDLPYIYAGGALELASFFKINYTMGEENPYASGSNNVLITVKTQLEKITTRILPISFILDIGKIDQIKADKVGLNLMEQYEKGIDYRYNKYLDQVSFFGLPSVQNSYGLANNSNVTTVVEATTAWASQTAIDLFQNLNDIMIGRIIACEYDSRFTPDRILVPITLFTKLALPMAIAGTNNATATTGISLFEYLKRNLASNYAGYDGNVDILPNRYLAGIGTNSTGRMIFYKYSEELVRGVLGMELTRGATMFDPNSQSIKTSYVAFVGEPQFIYTAPIAYYDNKA